MVKAQTGRSKHRKTEALFPSYVELHHIRLGGHNAYLSYLSLHVIYTWGTGSDTDPNPHKSHRALHCLALSLII